MLAHLCSVPIRWPMPDNTSRDGKEVHELFLLAVYYDVRDLIGLQVDLMIVI
jgi:hypothetical protein